MTSGKNTIECKEAVLSWATLKINSWFFLFSFYPPLLLASLDKMAVKIIFRTIIVHLFQIWAYRYIFSEFNFKDRLAGVNHLTKKSNNLLN